MGLQRKGPSARGHLVHSVRTRPRAIRSAYPKVGPCGIVRLRAPYRLPRRMGPRASKLVVVLLIVLLALSAVVSLLLYFI